MNKKILAVAMTAAFMMPAAFAAYLGDANGGANNGTNDDAVDIQTVSVEVEEVALLNIATGTIDLSEAFTVPTTAGNGFTGSADATSTYAISSNVKNISPTPREVTVAVASSGTGALPEGAQLSITLASPGNGAVAGTAILKAGTTSASSVTNIGNIAAASSNITYKLEVDTAAATGGMIAYTTTTGGDTISLTYTLTDD